MDLLQSYKKKILHETKIVFQYIFSKQLVSRAHTKREVSHLQALFIRPIQSDFTEHIICFKKIDMYKKKVQDPSKAIMLRFECEYQWEYVVITPIL